MSPAMSGTPGPPSRTRPASAPQSVPSRPAGRRRCVTRLTAANSAGLDGGHLRMWVINGAADVNGEQRQAGRRRNAPSSDPHPLASDGVESACRPCGEGRAGHHEQDGTRRQSHAREVMEAVAAASAARAVIVASPKPAMMPATARGGLASLDASVPDPDRRRHAARRSCHGDDGRVGSASRDDQRRPADPTRVAPPVSTAPPPASDATDANRSIGRSFRSRSARPVDDGEVVSVASPAVAARSSFAIPLWSLRWRRGGAGPRPGGRLDRS